MAIISVVMPVWNRAHQVGTAIDSALAQELPEGGWSLEIIVVDDGSTDDLAAALRPYGTRLTFVRHDVNKGAAAARNSGIAAATGDLIAFLDSDDVWLAGKLAAQVAFMQSTSYLVTCTACYLARAGAPDLVWPRYKTGPITHFDLLRGCFLSPGTTMVCEARVFKDMGLYDTNLARHEDWDWLLRFAAQKSLGFLARPLARVEPSSYADVRGTLDVLDQIANKHLPSLSRREGNYLRAALSFEAGAAYYRHGERFGALRELVKSLWLSPSGSVALGAVVAKRFWWR
jgi:glycosyltransferase involved in cell wall biosynthesis